MSVRANGGDIKRNRTFNTVQIIVDTNSSRYKKRCCYSCKVRFCRKSKLEKILFIADAIEPNRRPYPGLEELRQLVQTDLDAAVLASMRRTREYVLSKGGRFCTITEAAMQELAAQKEENA